MITTVPAFLLALAILIVFHEYGHYRVARACGVKVLRFSIGFGRVLWRRQRDADATEFVVCALPLGGYVRMLDEREAPVPLELQDQAFNRKPLVQRAAIVAAGPIANLALAIVFYAAANWLGTEEPKAVLGSPVAGSVADRAGLHSGDWVRAYSRDGQNWQDLQSLTDLRREITLAALDHEDLQLMLSDVEGHGQRTATLQWGNLDTREVNDELMRRIGLGSPAGDPVMGEVVDKGVAATAGLRKGDRVRAIDGRAVDSAGDLLQRIRAAVDDGQPRTLRWSIERDGEPLELTVRPRVVAEGDKSVGRIDAYIGQRPEMVQVRYGFLPGLTRAFALTWQDSATTLSMIGRMVIGQASVKNLSGPLTIADFAGQSARRGLSYYIGFLAAVSVSLGVLNLLPLPLLDGGHLMYYLFEGVTGRPVSELWLVWLQRGGAVIMLLMMSLALSNDVARLLGLQ